jgi:anaerobic sulfite reductase subunit B
MVPSRYQVRRRRRELPDTVTLALEPLDGPTPGFAPGQFNMLYAFGVGEIPISISGDPTREGPLVQTVRAVGAVSRALCAARPGTCSAFAARSAPAGTWSERPDRTW